MNNDNALMLEALAKSRSPKQVLSEGDEFEDDYTSPGIRVFFNSDNRYTVMFFRKPGNPKGIMTYGLGARRANFIDDDNKAKFWKLASKKHFLYAPYFGMMSANSGTWIFNWWKTPTQPPAPQAGDLVKVNWAEGFIEGEDFEFVRK